MPPLADADDAAIERFIDAIWAERGLSQATLAAYRRDLQGLARWRGTLDGIDREALFEYLAMRAGAGYTPRSNARLLSTLRAWSAYCVQCGERHDDPAALLHPPLLAPHEPAQGSAQHWRRRGTASTSIPARISAVSTSASASAAD